MAKRKIDEKLQAKFDKPQFSLEDAVYFSFLGSKQYGYVTKIKITNWGIQYTVQSSQGTKYPCGICIKGVKTAYDIGVIFFEESKQIGSDECRRRYDTSKTSKPVNRVSRDTSRPEIESGGSDSPSKSNADSSTRKVDATSRARHSSKNASKSSSNGVPPSNRKKRGTVKNAELTDAIQRQKDFLNGFVKRD